MVKNFNKEERRRMSKEIVKDIGDTFTKDDKDI